MQQYKHEASPMRRIFSILFLLLFLAACDSTVPEPEPEPTEPEPTTEPDGVIR